MGDVTPLLFAFSFGLYDKVREEYTNDTVFQLRILFIPQNVGCILEQFKIFLVCWQCGFGGLPFSQQFTLLILEAITLLFLRLQVVMLLQYGIVTDKVFGTLILLFFQGYGLIERRHPRLVFFKCLFEPLLGLANPVVVVLFGGELMFLQEVNNVQCDQLRRS